MLKLESFIHCGIVEKYSLYITMDFKYMLEIQDFIKNEENILLFSPKQELSQLEFINKNLASNLSILKKLIELLKSILNVIFY